MIQLKNKSELERMKKACQISAQALVVAGEHIRAGMTTLELDRILHHFIVSQGAKPSFLGYGGFPGTACISVNDEVIHGIPSSERVLREGDIVSVDVGACIDGFHGDNAFTFPVGQIREEAQKLLDVTQKSLYLGIEAAPGRPSGRRYRRGGPSVGGAKRFCCCPPVCGTWRGP